MVQGVLLYCDAGQTRAFERSLFDFDFDFDFFFFGLTFFRCSHHIYNFGREYHKCCRELISKKPELRLNGE